MEDLFTDTQTQGDVFTSEPVPLPSANLEQDSITEVGVVPESVSEPDSEPILEVDPVPNDVESKADLEIESVVTEVSESSDYVDYTNLLERLHEDLITNQQELVSLRSQVDSVTSGLTVCVFLLAFLAGILLSQIFTSYFRP